MIKAIVLAAALLGPQEDKEAAEAVVTHRETRRESPAPVLRQHLVRH